MKVEKEKESKAVANRIRFIDQYGNCIPEIIEYDPDTSIAVVWEPENVVDGPLKKKEKFYPGGHIVVDEVSNPNEEQITKIRNKHNA